MTMTTELQCPTPPGEGSASAIRPPVSTGSRRRRRGAAAGAVDRQSGRADRDRRRKLTAPLVRLVGAGDGQVPSTPDIQIEPVASGAAR